MLKQKKKRQAKQRIPQSMTQMEHHAPVAQSQTPTRKKKLPLQFDKLKENKQLEKIGRKRKYVSISTSNARLGFIKEEEK